MIVSRGPGFVQELPSSPSAMQGQDAGASRGRGVGFEIFKAFSRWGLTLLLRMVIFCAFKREIEDKGRI